MRQKFFRFVLITLVLTAGILFVIAWSKYSETMRINARCDVFPPSVSILSRSDRVLIGARYTEVADNNGVVLLVHGLDTCKDDPRLIVTEQAYQRMQYSTLAIDMRSHGSSADGGPLHGFGSLRANDILGAFDWLAEKGIADEKIVLHGQSLGGSAALLAALREPLISRVIAEDPILNFDQIVLDRGSPGWFLPIFKMIGQLRGFDLSHQPVDICNTPSPRQSVLVLHVIDDPVTPVSQLEFIRPNTEACSTKRIVGDWHIGWAKQDPSAFETTLSEWLSNPG